MDPDSLNIDPQTFWQTIVSASTYDTHPASGHRHFYPACLPDNRQLALPIRPLKEGKEALASLIINQASFAVLDVFATELARRCRVHTPDVVVGVPTLGLALAQETARQLGHTRYVPLSTSRKFWYDDELSVELNSITSPGQIKRLYIDPRMLPLLINKSILLIDDVLSTGASIVSACKLLEKCQLKPSLIGCAMLQTTRWRKQIDAFDQKIAKHVLGVIATPRLIPHGDKAWVAEGDSDVCEVDT